MFGLAVVVAVGVGMFAPPLIEKRSERRVRTALLAVQEGLQRFHVREEIYPRRAMTGHELVELLVSGGHLDGELANPWTGRPYLSSPDDDWLRYRSDSLAETYELTVLVRGGEEVRFRLDSTKNQSLE